MLADFLSVVVDYSFCTGWGGPRGEGANVLDCEIVVSEFKLQSQYYFQLWTNTLGNGVNSLIPPVMH